MRNSLSMMLFALVLSACGGGSSGEKNSETVGPDTVFTISGSVTAASGSDYDSDVQPRVGSIRLDSSTKDLNNPVTLGGYLSVDSGLYSAAPGDSAANYEADPQDTYRISLAANQQIRLSVFFADHDPDGQSINVRLSLRDISAPEVELQGFTVSSESTQSLSVAQSGDTVLRLDALGSSGPVLYTLTVSEQIGSSGSSPATNMSSNFVPGDVIVKLRRPEQGANISAANNRVSQLRQKVMNHHALKRHGMVGRDAELYRLEATGISAQHAAEQGLEHWPEGMRRKWQTLQAIEALKRDPDVLYAEPNFIRKAAAIPNDPQFNRQWNMSMLDLPAAWDLTQGQGVTIAVLDTGVDTSHLDLINNINFADGYDFVSNVTSAGDADGRDHNPFDLDPNNHGTHVAGIVAAAGDNDIGIAGVAYGATIMPLRVLGANGDGTDADVAAAIYYAAGLANSAGVLPSRRADIINLSLGSNEASNTMETAINAAIDAGVIVVAAAGNNGNDEPFYPAAHGRVIAVSSVTYNKTRSSFSNFGDFIDVAAPGGGGSFNDGVLSTLYASEYGELMGTSMAAPHVSGVIALMLERDNTLTLNRLLFGLDAGDLTENIGSSDSFGAGLIKAAKALIWLNEDIPDQLNIFPTQLAFVGADSEASLTLSNPGTGTVIAGLPTASETWLEVVPGDQVGPNGLGRYEVNVKRDDLPQTGSFTAFITVPWSINGQPQRGQRIEVFVSYFIESQDHVGQLYIYLLPKQVVDDADEGDTIDIYASVNGAYNTTTHRYDFSIVGVEPGEYYVEASTDNDGDYFVYDDGEARGAYPLRALPTSIRISDGNVDGLVFDVAYDSLADSTGAAMVRRLGKTVVVDRARRTND